MLPSLPQPSMVNWTSIPIPVLIIQEVYVAALSAFPPPFKALRTNSTKWYLTGTFVVSKIPRPICWSGLRNLTALQLVTNGWLWWKTPVSKSKSSNLNHWTKRFGCGQYSKHFASNHRKFKHNVLNHQCNHYVHKYLYVMWNLFTKKDNTLNQALLSKAPHISICYQGKSKVRKALIQLQISWQLLAFGYLQEKNVRVRNHPHPSFLEREVSPESVSPSKIVNWDGNISHLWNNSIILQSDIIFNMLDKDSVTFWMVVSLMMMMMIMTSIDIFTRQTKACFEKEGNSYGV